MIDALSSVEAYLENAGLLDVPGAVLYSSIDTLKHGPVYLLGLNPGGTEGDSLRDSLGKTRAGKNAYLDEQWAPGGHVQPKGQATLQRRIQNLCKIMGLETRNVPASNLVFTRSTRTGEHLDFAGALPICLPVHHIFMEVIKPKFLMTFGSIDNFSSAVTISHIESRLADHGTWKAHRGRATFNGHEVAFGNVPHMSLWASDKRTTVVEWAVSGFVAGS